MAEGDWWDNGNTYADSTFQGGQPDTTNYGTGSTDYSSYYNKAKSMAAELGITPASALKYLVKAAGPAAAAGLGAAAANQQSGALQALNDKYMAMGAPSRDRYEASYAPGFTMASDPGYTDALNQTAKASAHAMSVNGNPAGSPNAWTQTLSDVNSKFAYPAMQQYRNQNAATGGIASFSAAAPSMATGAIGAQGDMYNAIGAGINDIFNPRKSLAQQMLELKQSGMYP